MTTVQPDHLLEAIRCRHCNAVMERAELNIGVYSEPYCPMGCDDDDDPDDYDESD